MTKSWATPPSPFSDTTCHTHHRPQPGPAPAAWSVKLARVTQLCLLAGASFFAATTAAQPKPNNPPPSSSSPSALNPQERLEAIRASLIDASLQTPTAVRGMSWVDSRGGLHELSVFKNSLNVQGVQIKGYERSADGELKARLDLPAQAAHGSAQTDSATGSGSTSAPAAQTAGDTGKRCVKALTGERLRHVIQFSYHPAPDTHPALAQVLPLMIHAQWLAAQPSGQPWQMVPDLSRPLIDHEITAYERELLGNQSSTQPWQAQLLVSSQWVQMRRPDSWFKTDTVLMLRMALQLRRPDGTDSPRELQAVIPVPLVTSEWSPATLDDPGLASIRLQLQKWHQLLSNWLRCEPLHPQVLRAQGQTLIINAGALAGLQAGDEWLVADPARFPKRLLEPDGASQTLLAKVTAVSANAAALTVLAGPAGAAQANWRAWPVDTVLQEVSVNKPVNQSQAAKPAKPAKPVQISALPNRARPSQTP